jgi:hypothetical protein
VHLEHGRCNVFDWNGKVQEVDLRLDQPCAVSERIGGQELVAVETPRAVVIVRAFAGWSSTSTVRFMSDVQCAATSSSPGEYSVAAGDLNGRVQVQTFRYEAPLR